MGCVLTRETSNFFLWGEGGVLEEEEEEEEVGREEGNGRINVESEYNKSKQHTNCRTTKNNSFILRICWLLRTSRNLKDFSPFGPRSSFSRRLGGGRDPLHFLNIPDICERVCGVNDGLRNRWKLKATAVFSND